jgi:hypothetical protein
MNSITPESFGLHVRFVAVPAPAYQSLSAWPWIAHGAIRIWNAYTAWYDINPAPGVFDFYRLDQIVDHAASRGKRILITLGRTPTWASARPNEVSKAMPGSAAEPANICDWEDYVRAVVMRYGTRVEGYEIWNEPGFSDFENVYNEDGSVKQYYSGSAASMVKLTQHARAIIKSIHPAALVVSPSVTCEGDGLGRLGAFLAAGGGELCDVLGYHFYQPYPEDVIEELERLNHMQWSRGLSLPIWDTEIGYILDEGDSTPIDSVYERTSWTTPLSPRNAGIYCARAYILQLALGIKRVYWYTWDHNIAPDPMGLSDGGTVLNDQGTAYSKIGGWLAGAIYRRMERSSSGLWSVIFFRGHTPFTIRWREVGSEYVNTTPRTTAESLFGQAMVTNGEPMLIDQEPVLMVDHT